MSRLLVSQHAACRVRRLTGRHIVCLTLGPDFLTKAISFRIRLFQMGGIFGGDAGGIGLVLCLCFGNGILQEASHSGLHSFQLFQLLRSGVLFCPVQRTIFAEKLLFHLQLIFPHS